MNVLTPFLPSALALASSCRPAATPISEGSGGPLTPPPDPLTSCNSDKDYDALILGTQNAMKGSRHNLLTALACIRLLEEKDEDL